MNLYSDYRKKFKNFLEILKNKNIINLPENFITVSVEPPPKNYQSDISCNVAMVLSRFNKKNPIDLATLLKKHFSENFSEFENIDVVKPGFLNFSFKLNFWRKYIFEIINSDKDYGSNKTNKLKYNIEFVSANPTGPLHVGHCRGAVLGDVLSNLLKFNGHIVTKEYYVNDFGNQIKNFVYSVYYRICEIKFQKTFPNDKDFYPGEYIIHIAKKIISKSSINDFSDIGKIYDVLTKDSLKYSMELIKDNLNILGIKHDIFVKESDLVNSNSVSKVLKKLQNRKYVYKGKLSPPKGELNKNWKSRELLLFASTKFGDDTDRALQKNDDEWTYFASDIAYHSNKVDRKFDVLINILGADHSGYIKRINAAVKAVSNNKMDLICKISQLVKLFKNGKPFKMSKRKGDYITVEDLIKEVGKDSTRFMMLNRSNDVELDFDFKKVLEKSKENPVFYVQYAYARINSIFSVLKLNLDDNIEINSKDFDPNSHEIKILKKISEWPKCIELSSAKLEPHRIPFFLYDLSTLFHSYWNLGKENEKLRFILKNNSYNKSRLIILKAIAIVIKNGMSILGVSTPKSM